MHFSSYTQHSQKGVCLPGCVHGLFQMGAICRNWREWWAAAVINPPFGAGGWILAVGDEGGRASPHSGCREGYSCCCTPCLETWTERLVEKCSSLLPLLNPCLPLGKTAWISRTGKSEPKDVMVAWFFFSCWEIRVALGCSRCYDLQKMIWCFQGTQSVRLHKPCVQVGQQKWQWFWVLLLYEASHSESKTGPGNFIDL